MNKNEIKKIIKGFNCVKFKIESLDGLPILPSYIENRTHAIPYTLDYGLSE